MSTLQALRTKQKLLEAGELVVNEFVPDWLRGSALTQLRQQLWDIKPLQAEELIRKLKAILDA